MFTFAIETSSPLGSVALLREEKYLAEITFGAKERHSAELVPAVQKLLAKTKVRAEQIDLWVVGLGPGSFLGIRVGIAAAKGFALATKKPLVGVPSFHAVALEHLRDQPTLDVTLDAGRGDLYWAHYHRDCSIPEIPIQLISAANAPPLPRSAAPCPHAQFVARLGREKFLTQRASDTTLEPIYLRETKFVKVAVKP